MRRRNACRGNSTHQKFHSYMLEFALHEMLLQSTHLTHDPEEADFFFVPLYVSCFVWPIHGHTLFPYFFEHGVSEGPGVQALCCANVLIMLALCSKFWAHGVHRYFEPAENMATFM